MRKSIKGYDVRWMRADVGWLREDGRCKTGVLWGEGEEK